jgi:hypothetical protein
MVRETSLGNGEKCVGEKYIKYKTKMAICHHKYAGIHLTNLSTEGIFFSSNLIWNLCLSIFLFGSLFHKVFWMEALWATSLIILVISIALVNLHRQQSTGLYAIFGDEV